ncbi:glutathione transferase GstA [Burkholderia sp. Bp9012]|uniref:glutathione transferase GstA n=1 Tax=Burkholderia sp. Bp9012 TaxID=2184562 RepID=UPI000F59CDFD|nr:glutathione transferase GstA [Burkholderia sp. Bp9012]RQR79137.1 glutathione transferase GstA [Burkholderia sp. Bp9012]
MKLYFSPGTCSMAVHIALREVGAPFEGIKVDLATHTTEDGGDYYQVSPRGYVPLLETDDSARHTEVVALLLRIAESDASHGLIPPVGNAARQDAVQWLAFISSELHKTFSWLWSSDTAESTVAACKKKLALRFHELDQHLAGREYLAGKRFSIADAYGFTIVNWANFLGIDLKPYPHLSAYLDRVAARPSVHETMTAEGLIKAAA